MFLYYMIVVIYFFKW